MLCNLLLDRIKGVLILLKRKPWHDNNRTYYPEYERKKSRTRIFLDELFIVLKYGHYEPYYYLYGFDREEITIKQIKDDYIVPITNFQKKQLYANTHIKGFVLPGRVIVADKFYFNLLLEKLNVPTPHLFCYIHNKQVLFMDDNYCSGDQLSTEEKLSFFLTHDMDAFCKPSCGEAGDGVFSLKVTNRVIFIDGNRTNENTVIEKLLSKDYIIQEKIHQNERLNALCGTCVNTIRIQTVKGEHGEIVPFGAGLRIGRSGSTIDNWAKGGIFVGIDMTQGCLMDKGFYTPKSGSSVMQHPDSLIVFKDYEVPYFSETVQLVTRVHQLLYRMHSIGWDIAITPDGPVIIEGNSSWDLSLIQAAHGGLKKQIGAYFNL